MKAHIKTGWKHFWKQIFRVLRNPIFSILTMFGNAVLLSSATAFYFFEKSTNPQVHDFWDALWWALITMTTVGYGDIIPTTVFGRVIAIGLIFIGSVLFLSFIALLSSAFIELEFAELQNEVSELKENMNKSLKSPH